MITFKKLLYCLITVAVLTACAPASNSDNYVATETSATEYVEPTYESVREFSGSWYYERYCTGTWINQTEDPEFNGLISKTSLISKVEDREFKTVTIEYLVSLKEILINDRVIYPNDNWLVLQRIPDNSDQGYHLTHELNPQEWVEKAQDLTKLAPDLIITLIASWKYDEFSEYYEWDYQPAETPCRAK